jgi:hypothetical protein
MKSKLKQNRLNTDYKLLQYIFWLEKLLIFIDYFQILGVLWITAQPWPWPYLWIKWMKWTPLFNFDFFSLTKNGALNGKTSNISISSWGEMNGYLNYALFFSCASAILSLLFLSLPTIEHQITVKFTLNKSYFRLFLYPLVYVLYIPLLLSFVRLLYCNPSLHTLAVDPHITCYSSSHILYLILCGVMHIFLIFGLPNYLYMICSNNMVYKSRKDHEQAQQVAQLLQIFGVHNHWLYMNEWIICSFKRPGIYYYLHILLYKSMMVICYISIRTSLKTQASTMWIITLLFALYYGVLYPPYHCKTSNFIQRICLILLIIDTSTGAANAWGVRNSALVGSIESSWLLTFHLIGGILVLGGLMICWLDPRGNPEAVLTVKAMLSDPDRNHRVAEYIDCLKSAYATQLNFTLAHDAIADIEALQTCIRKLRECCAFAQCENSVFITPLDEALEQLLLLRDERRGC